jgi:hypothetical protein
VRQILFRSGYQKYIIGFGFLFGLLFSVRLWGAESEKGSLQSLLSAMYWGVEPESGIIGMLLPLIPAMVFCAVMSNFLADDYAIVGVYLLPRSGKAWRWYLPKLCALWLHALEFSAVFVGCLIIAQRGVSWRALLLVGYYGVSLCALITLIAVLSLRVQAKWVMVGGTLLLAVAMIMAKASQGKSIAFFHPLYHFFPDWLKNPAMISIAYFLLIIFASVLVGSFLIRKKDIFLLRKDS